MNSRRNLWTKHLKERSHFVKTPILKNANFEGVVLGIDPSLRGSGFAVVEAQQGHFKLLDSLTLKLSPKLDFVQCLGELFLTTQRFLETFAIKAVSVESTIYVQNSKTVHVLGSARGACLAAVALKNLPVKEFPPLRIKKSIVGVGQATKEQVGKMLIQLLQLPACLPLDESDAAATALCYFFSLKSLIH